MIRNRMRVHDSTLDIRRRMSSGVSVLAAVFLFAICTPRAAGQNFTVLYTFTGAGDGAFPGDVALDGNGNLYGSTYQGGSFGYGIVFKLASNGKETVLHNFAGGDGMGAGGSLLRDAAGNLYGATFEGGTPEGGTCRFGCGTLFKLDKTGLESILYAFPGHTYIANPGGLARDESGNFYGTTQGDGVNSWGTVFKVDNAGKLTVLHQFTGGKDGGLPYGTLILDARGDLYGTTVSGGKKCSCGVVFKVDRAGKEKVLHAFAGGIDGSGPYGGLVRDSAGNLYGTTSYGGDMSCDRIGCGTVFRLDKIGKKALLYTFRGPDGSTPYMSLVRDSAGALYGTTGLGGNSAGCNNKGCGTVFKLDASGKETVLYSFTGGADGNLPGNLFPDAAGVLYGSTGEGGDLSHCPFNYGGCGVIFKLIP